MNRDKLKSVIKALAAEGRALQQRIQQASGLERHALWDQKRCLGRRARAALLGYGFVRGVPYPRIEPRCHEGNRPQAAALAANAEPGGPGPPFGDRIGRVQDLERGRAPALVGATERPHRLAFGGTDHHALGRQALHRHPARPCSRTPSRAGLPCPPAVWRRAPGRRPSVVRTLQLPRSAGRRE